MVFYLLLLHARNFSCTVCKFEWLDQIKGNLKQMPFVNAFGTPSTRSVYKSACVFIRMELTYCTYLFCGAILMYRTTMNLFRRKYYFSCFQGVYSRFQEYVEGFYDVVKMFLIVCLSFQIVATVLFELYRGWSGIFEIIICL